MSGCILGCISVTASNNQIDFTEDPGGTPASFTTQLPLGDYFPDSDKQAEDLAYFIQSAMNDVGAYTYTVSFSSTTGIMQITTPDGTFQLLTSSSYSDSIFLECGYPDTDPTSSTLVGVDYNTATASPSGTWYPGTPDNEENLKSDLRWSIERKYKNTEGSTGALYTRRWGEIQSRSITFGPIVGSVGYSASVYDVERALTCFENHWSYGYRVRVFVDTQTVTIPKDGKDVFDAYVLDDEIQPRRFQGYEETDLWEVSINLSKYTSDDGMSYPKNYLYNLNISNNSSNPAYQIDISTGQCRSSDNTTDMDATSTITVDITASGANGLDTGTEANSTWYFVWLIKNLSTNTVAGLLSTSSTAPTMPSGYTKKKRIGAVRNDSSGNLLDIEQTGAGPYKITRYKEVYSGDVYVLQTGVSATYANVDMSGVVPTTATETEAHIWVEGPGDMYVREDGESVDRMKIFSDYQDGIILQMGSGPASVWEYKTTGEAHIEVLSYTELL